MDLGNDHHLTFMKWAPADTPENRSLFGIPDEQPMPTVEEFGVTIEHPNSNGQRCVITVHFSGYWQKECNKLCTPPSVGEGLDIEVMEPLTCTQPISCGASITDGHGNKVGICNDRGKIQNGKWVPL